MIEVKQNKAKKILIIALILVLVVGLGFGGYYLYNNVFKGNNNSSETIKPTLKDDFYGSINYETIEKATIPNDNNSWSKFYDAKKTIETRRDEIVEEILNDKTYKNEDIENIIELYNDIEGRNKRGISELQPYFNMIDKAKTIAEFNKALITIDKDLDVDIIINPAISNDLYDSTKQMFMFQQAAIMGNSYELFTEAKYKNYVALYEDMMGIYFTELGYPKEKQEELIKQIEDYAKLIQSKSIKSDDVKTAFDIYNKYTLDEIEKNIKNIPIKDYLKGLKLSDLEYYIVVDMGNLKAIDEYYTVEHLSIFKEIAKLNILNEYNSVTSIENAKKEIEYYNKAQGTSMTIEDLDKEIISGIKEEFLSDEIQKRYEAKYFTEEDKKKVADLVNDVKDYYKEVIKKTDWLSETTKEKALNKLDKMKVNIGYQGEKNKQTDVYKVVSKAKGGTFISNKIGKNRLAYSILYKEFHKEASLESLSTLEVNAFYNPQDNSINFLAGFKEVYNDENDYYRLLGFFGSVIGHEISHAFDNTGSKYDENGKVIDWWTKEDKENYEKLTEKIKDYYSNYEFMGFKVNGQKTLGENIADLAAMKAMVSIAEAKGATKDDYKKLFEAYAELWAEKINKQGAESGILSDVHAPSKVRVNAVLSSIDKFYEVYDIKETDKMYVAKENRVSLW